MIRYTVCCLSLLLLCTAGGSIALGQVPLRVTQWGEVIGYREKVLALCKSHIDNHRVVSTRKFWEPDKHRYKGSLYELSSTTAVHAPGKWLQKGSYGRIDTTTKTGYGQFLDEDVFYNLRSKTLELPYDLGSFATEWKDPQRYGTTFESFEATKQIYVPRSDEKLLSHERSHFEGRDVLKLTSRQELGITKIIYLDRDTYQLLYWESDKAVDFSKAGSLTDDRTFTRVTYRDAGRDKRLPVKAEWYRMTTDGQRQNIYEYEFQEYEPYTPSADDLDLEKQFGIKPIAHEPRPASAMPPPPKPKSRAFWWYAAGGGMLVVTVALVLLARRRRAVASA